MPGWEEVGKLGRGRQPPAACSTAGKFSPVIRPKAQQTCHPIRTNQLRLGPLCHCAAALRRSDARLKLKGSLCWLSRHLSAGPPRPSAVSQKRPSQATSWLGPCLGKALLTCRALSARHWQLWLQCSSNAKQTAQFQAADFVFEHSGRLASIPTVKSVDFLPRMSAHW